MVAGGVRRPRGKLLADSGIDAAAIAAVGFSGMMMGCLPVAADGTPLRSCIIWADQRAQAEAAFVAERCGADEVYLRCGHRTSPAYCAPKILWVRNHQPEIYRAHGQVSRAQGLHRSQADRRVCHRLLGRVGHAAL